MRDGEGGLSPALAALAGGAKREAVPPFEVNIAKPELRPWREGNALPGVWSFSAAASGPHVALVAVVHGNEIAGAALLDRWLRAGLRPARGRLSLVFANMEAFDRFDPADPTASRFVDEDLNRLWDEAVLAGGRRSCELRRARALRPLLDTVDVLLDLHSMLWPSDPLVLAGRTERARRLALDLGVPPLVVADEGHAGGRRMIDYRGFAEADGARIGLLVEAGAHWEAPTVAAMEATAAALLRRCGVAAADDEVLPPPPSPGAAAQRPRLAEVTRTVTATGAGFAFVRPYRGGDVVPERNTLIALDGEDGDPHAARRLPAGDAEPPHHARPHRGAAGAVRGGLRAGGSARRRLAFPRFAARFAQQRRHGARRFFHLGGFGALGDQRHAAADAPAAAVIGVAAEVERRVAGLDRGQAVGDVALVDAVRVHGARHHRPSALQGRRQGLEHGAHDARHAGHDVDVAHGEAGRAGLVAADGHGAARQGRHAHAAPR